MFFILISIIALVAIVSVMMIVTRNKVDKNFTIFGALAFVFIIAGMFAPEPRLIGYSLLALGVAMAFMDIVQKL